MANEEILMKLNFFQQQSEKMQEHVQIINQQISEFEVLKLSLEKLDENSNKEILAPLGKGIFLKSKPLEREFFVNVGENIVVKRNTKDTCKIIDRQINELEGIKTKILENIQQINEELENLLEEAQNKNKEK